MDHKCDLTENNIYLNMDRNREKTCYHMRLPPCQSKISFAVDNPQCCYSVSEEGEFRKEVQGAASSLSLIFPCCTMFLYHFLMDTALRSELSCDFGFLPGRSRA